MQSRHLPSKKLSERARKICFYLLTLSNKQNKVELLRPGIFSKRLGVTGFESSGQNGLQKVSFCPLKITFYILFHCFVIVPIFLQT